MIFNLDTQPTQDHPWSSICGTRSFFVHTVCKNFVASVARRDLKMLAGPKRIRLLMSEAGIPEIEAAIQSYLIIQGSRNLAVHLEDVGKIGVGSGFLYLRCWRRKGIYGL